VHLLDPAPRRPAEIQRVFRASSAGILAWVVAGVAFAAGFAFLVRTAAPSLHGIAWVVASPLFFACGVALLVAIRAGVGAFRASLREANWILGVARDGVYLNVRSYLNAVPNDPTPTVAFVAFSEIASACKVVERWDLDRGDESTTRLDAFLELALAGVDTAPLAEAVRAEAARVPPERSFLGVRVRTKVLDRPVFVAEPGIVRVRWKRGLLAALEGRVRIEPPRKARMGSGPGRVLDLVRRGDRLAAIAAARSEGARSLAEARSLVEEVERGA
jgi:hypothetical protein